MAGLSIQRFVERETLWVDLATKALQLSHLCRKEKCCFSDFAHNLCGYQFTTSPWIVCNSLALFRVADIFVNGPLIVLDDRATPNSLKSLWQQKICRHFLCLVEIRTNQLNTFFCSAATIDFDVSNVSDCDIRVLSYTGSSFSYNVVLICVVYLVSYLFRYCKQVIRHLLDRTIFSQSI